MHINKNNLHSGYYPTCLQIFTQPELLQDEDAYHCEKCANNSHINNKSSVEIELDLLLATCLRITAKSAHTILRTATIISSSL